MKNFTKNFTNWFSIKPILDQRTQVPSFSEREIWMCYWGTNVGFEIDGKNDESLRPVIIFKKLSHETALAIPLSSGNKAGTWYSPSLVQGVLGRYCFNQLKMIDRKRLKYRLEKISSHDFERLKKDFQKFIFH